MLSKLKEEIENSEWGIYGWRSRGVLRLTSVCVCVRVYMSVCMQRSYHMHTRTRLIHNRSRSADLCVYASRIMSFQSAHPSEERETEDIKEKQDKEPCPIHYRKWLRFSRLPWLMNYGREGLNGWKREAKTRWDTSIASVSSKSNGKIIVKWVHRAVSLHITLTVASEH